MQNMVNNGSGQLVLVNVIESVRHKTASADETRKGVNRGQAVLEGERNDTLAMHEDCRVGQNHQAAVGCARKRFRGALDIGGGYDLLGN